MFNLKAIETVPVNDEPWRWAVIEDTFSSAEEATTLAGEFPVDGFRWFYSATGHKRYRYWGRFLIEPGADQLSTPGDLSPAWLRFGKESLLSADYRRAVGDAIGQDLSGAEMEATFWRYDPGCWFSAHVGGPERIVNHVIYFNEDWSVEDGGYLHIVPSGDPDAEPTAKIEPLLGRSAFIVRSDNSWHAIDPVTLNRGPSRRTVVVSFRHPA